MRTRHAMRDALLPRSDGEQGIGGARCLSLSGFHRHASDGRGAGA
jgi:hypothetical protein